MNLSRIKSDNNMIRLFANVDGPLSVKGFLLRVYGTSAGTAVYVSDVGRVFLRRRGDVRVSADFDVLQIENRSNFRNPEITNNGVIGAYAFSCYIPRVLPGSKDVELIEPDDNYEIEITFGANIAAFTTGFRAELYADLDVGKCWYDLQLLQQQWNYTAAGTDNVTISAENIVESILTARSSGTGLPATLVGQNIAEVTTQWGKNHGCGLLAAWQSLEAIRKPIAAASSLLGVTLHMAEGEISGALEDRIGVGWILTGASVPVVLTTGMKFNREKQVVSSANDATDLASKLAAKGRAGHVQAAAVIQDALGVAMKAVD